jgi:hypothetical protein
VPGLHEEAVRGLLESGDGALSVGEGGLEMGEDVRGRLAHGIAGRGPGRCIRWRAASKEGRADLALGQVEAFPDALPIAFVQPAIDGAAGGEDATCDDVLEELPQGGGGEVEASDFVDEPDAEGPPATGPVIAVAAKDAAGAEGPFPGAALVESVETAVAIQSADRVAVRARHLLEPLCDALPFLVVTKKNQRCSTMVRASGK